MFKNLLTCVFLIGALSALGHSKKFPKLYEKIVFDDLVKLLDDGNTLIVDLREPFEIEETGQIPNSVSIPIRTEFVYAFGRLTPEEFEEKYNRTQPSKDFRIVVYSRNGGRSVIAQAALETLDYTNCLDYAGGWYEWVEKYHPEQ